MHPYKKNAFTEWDILSLFLNFFQIFNILEFYEPYFGNHKIAVCCISIFPPHTLFNFPF